MSETPRTDDREFAAIDVKPSSRVVYASFARQLEAELAEANIEIEGLEEEIVALCDRLKRVNGGELERQLAEARAEIEHKNKIIEQMREALENIRDYPGHIDYTTGEVHSMQEIAIAALAAERGE